MSLFISVTIWLLAILNPASVLPYYLASTEKIPKTLLAKDALIMASAAFFILIIGWFVGPYILSLFNLEMRYFRIAWWILIAYNAFRMSMWKMPVWHHKTGKNADDIIWRWIIVPITMPLVSGPGSIAYIISLVSLGEIMYFPVSIAIVVCSIFYYLIIRYSEHVQLVLGSIWIALITRFMGLILLWIWIQAIFLNL